MLTLHTAAAGLQDPGIHVCPRLGRELVAREVGVVRRGDEVMAQRLGHILVHAAVLRVEDVTGRAPCVVGEACGEQHGWRGSEGFSPRVPVPHWAQLETTHPHGMWPPWHPTGSTAGPGWHPLTVNAHCPFTLVLWARFKLLDDVTTALKGHACHLGQSRGLRPSWPQAAPHPPPPQPTFPPHL